MPEISRFFGIVVKLHFNEHAPPHFHAEYEGRDVSIEIRTLRVAEGALRRRALALVLEWARLHQDELLAGWNRARAGRSPGRIAPLE